MVFSQTGTIGVKSALPMFSCLAEFKLTQISQSRMYRILKRMYGVLGESILCLAEFDIIHAAQVWIERQGGCYPIGQG